MNNYGLFLDRESVGPRVLKNPTVAIGVALIDMDRVCLAKDGEGGECLKEFYIPPLPGQEEDPQCVKDFWDRSVSNQLQLEEWRKIPPGEEKRTIVVKEFIDYCDRICHGKRVELFVDNPHFDTSGIDVLLDSTPHWEDKPPSWNFLLKKDGKRVYSKIVDVSSYLEGVLHLHPDTSEFARKLKGGLPQLIRELYTLPPAPNFPYNRDHHCSHDAARRGLEFASLRNLLKPHSNIF